MNYHNESDLLIEYYEMFEESSGIPFHGFPDDKTTREYCETLQRCIDTGVPLTKQQRFDFGLDIICDNEIVV